MTDEEKMEKVREDIANYIHMREQGICIYQDGSYPCQNDGCDNCTARAITSLPDILIKSDNQELPDCDTFRFVDLDKGGWNYDKELMAKNCPLLKQNRPRVIKKEG